MGVGAWPPAESATEVRYCGGGRVPRAVEGWPGGAMVTAGSWLEVEATGSCCAWISARICSRLRLKRPVSDSPGTGSGSVWGVGGIGVVVETDLVDARVDGLDKL